MADPVKELSHRFRDLDDLEDTPELQAALNHRLVVDTSWGHLASMLVEQDIVEPEKVREFLGISVEEMRDPSIVITEDPELGQGNPYDVIFDNIYSSLMDAELDETDEIFECLVKDAFVDRGWLGPVDEELARELEKLQMEEGSSDSWLDYEIRAARSEYKVPLLGFIAVAMKLDGEDNLFQGRALDMIDDWLTSYALAEELVDDADAAEDIVLDRPAIDSFFEYINDEKYIRVEKIARGRTRDILEVLKPRPLRQLLGAMHHSNPRA